MKKSTKYLTQELDKAEDEHRHLCCVEICNKLLKREPENSKYWYSLSAALHSLGRYDESMDALESTERYCKESKVSWVLSRKGTLLKDTGRYDEAISYFEEAHERSPNEASFLIFLGSTHFRNNNVFDAEIAARKAVLCSKGALDEAHYNLGCYLMSQNELEEAETNFRKAINLDPGYKLAKERLRDLSGLAKLRDPKLHLVKR